MLSKITLLIFLAFSCFHSALAQEPQVWEKYNQAVEAGKKGNLEEAINLYTETIKLDNGFARAYTGRGLAYMQIRPNNPAVQKQNWNASLADLSTAIDLKPSAGSYINRSSIYSVKKEYDKALADLQKAEEIEPKFPYIYAARGNIYSKMREFEKSLESYGKAISIKPYSQFYSGRCMTYYDYAKFQEAVADCSEAISLNPKDSMAYYYRGMARKKLEQNALAIGDLRKALEFNPNHQRAMQALEELLKTNKY